MTYFWNNVFPLALVLTVAIACGGGGTAARDAAGGGDTATGNDAAGGAPGSDVAPGADATPQNEARAETSSDAPDGPAGDVSCDPRRILCKRVAPTCDAGQVPSVEGSCYGPCVKIDACVCASAADCPDPLQFTCHVSARRCGPFVN
jgi:hypothetical protein